MLPFFANSMINFTKNIKINVTYDIIYKKRRGNE